MQANSTDVVNREIQKFLDNAHGSLRRDKEMEVVKVVQQRARNLRQPGLVRGEPEPRNAFHAVHRPDLERKV
jgi:hypothetical protein